jgi:hypothetical protein
MRNDGDKTRDPNRCVLPFYMPICLSVPHSAMPACQPACLQCVACALPLSALPLSALPLSALLPALYVACLRLH